MTPVEQIKAEIEALSPEDFVQLRKWIVEKDWELWDQQIEADSAAGKLDFLIEEAMAAKAEGKLREL